VRRRVESQSDLEACRWPNLNEPRSVWRRHIMSHRGRPAELSWLSASHRDKAQDAFIYVKQRPAGPIFKLLSFLSVGTKQQSRLKYSHSLMSIPFAGPRATPENCRPQHLAKGGCRVQCGAGRPGPRLLHARLTEAPRVTNGALSEAASSSAPRPPPDSDSERRGGQCSLLVSEGSAPRPGESSLSLTRVTDRAPLLVRAFLPCGTRPGPGPRESARAVFGRDESLRFEFWRRYAPRCTLVN
jgi:hypothetical protein